MQNATIKIPCYLTFAPAPQPRKPGDVANLIPGRGDAGWTVYSVHVVDMPGFVRRYQAHLMPNQCAPVRTEIEAAKS